MDSREERSTISVDSGYPKLFSGVEQESLVEFVLEGNDDYGK